MEWAEGTGRTLEDAQRDALEQLGASEDAVEFEVLERPGAFGSIFGRSTYRVRAILEYPEEHEPAPEEAPEAEEEAEPEPEPEIPHQDLAEIGRDMLQRMVDLIGVEGTVEIGECTEDEVRLNVEGEDMGLLIGRHGATLDAVQLIVAIGANRKVEDGARVIVDAEGYRARHKAMIEARARKLAEEAKDSGKEVVVPDLKAYERRLMHLALKKDPDVQTYSEGEGDERVLVISPVS
ncbi:MAG: RNA-binding cell elongation regulator Jag/EloR [Armatimonadota bacterium]|nr:RNA-binding cell elongation regulator Jag/EloR [Armatimonadota bacterium]